MMNYQERLKWLTATIRERTREVVISAIAEEDLPLLEVTGGLLRCCLEAAEGISSLLDVDRPSAAFPLERAAWEIWKEFHFLVSRESRQRDAIKLEVNAMLELTETLPKIDTEGAPDDLLARQTEVLQDRERRYPTIVAEVREQRRRKRFHWSGLRRGEVFAPSESDRLVYSLLSWEAHPIMGPLREVEVERSSEGGATLRFVTAASPRDVLERPAWAVTGYLWYSWTEFAELWRLPSVELPDV